MKPRQFRTKGFDYDRKTQTAVFRVVIRKPGGQKTSRRHRYIVDLRDGQPGQDPAEIARAQFDKFRAAVLLEVKPGHPKSLWRYWETRRDTLMQGLAETTAQTRAGIFQHRILPHLGDKPLEAINASEVNAWKGKLRAEKYAPDSINSAYAALRWLLYDAVEMEAIARFPIKERKKVKPEPKNEPKNELSPEEYRAYLAAFDDEAGFRAWVARTRKPHGEVTTFSTHKGTPVTKATGGGRRPDSEATKDLFRRFHAMKPFFIVALETGLDRGDLIRLTWLQANLKTGWIRVKRQKTSVESKIPFSALLRDTLEKCRKTAPFSDRVLSGYDQEEISEMTVRRYHEAAKAIAGITRPYRFKDNRHTFACRLATAGLSPLEISVALGHTSSRMSERYARVREQAVRDRIVTALNADAGVAPGVASPQASPTVSPDEQAKSSGSNH